MYMTSKVLILKLLFRHTNTHAHSHTHPNGLLCTRPRN